MGLKVVQVEMVQCTETMLLLKIHICMSVGVNTTRPSFLTRRHVHTYNRLVHLPIGASNDEVSAMLHLAMHLTCATAT